MDVLTRRFDIHGGALGWIQNYLSGRSQVVHASRSESGGMTLKYGVPQGSVLGPRIFIEYAEDGFGLISIDSADLFEVRQATATRGHPYKLFKPQCTINARSSFFTQRIINVWNDLPVNSTNFSSLNYFRNSLNKVDLSSYLVLG